MTWAVTHFITVPGGWPANNDASTLPGAGAIAVGLLETGVAGLVAV